MPTNLCSFKDFFLISERAKICWGLSQVSTVGGPFLQWISQTLNAPCTGELSMWAIQLSCVMPQLGYFLQIDSPNFLLLLASCLIFHLNTQRFVFCQHLHLSFVFLVAHLLGHLAYLLAIPLTAYATQKHSIFFTMYSS
jgi:hypothetical protein